MPAAEYRPIFRVGDLVLRDGISWGSVIRGSTYLVSRVRMNREDQELQIRGNLVDWFNSNKFSIVERASHVTAPASGFVVGQEVRIVSNEATGPEDYVGTIRTITRIEEEAMSDNTLRKRYFLGEYYWYGEDLELLGPVRNLESFKGYVESCKAVPSV